MTTPRYTFKKGERLARRRYIEQLFQSRCHFTVYPFRMIFCTIAAEEEFPAQVLISIPKRRVKKAVKRNLLKRRIREAYRVEKSVLYESLAQQSGLFLLGIIYIGNEEESYEKISQSIKRGIRTIMEKR